MMLLVVWRATRRQLGVGDGPVPVVVAGKGSALAGGVGGGPLAQTEVGPSGSMLGEVGGMRLRAVLGVLQKRWGQGRVATTCSR